MAGKILPLIISFSLISCQQWQQEQSVNSFQGDWIEMMPVNTHIIQGITMEDNGIARTIGVSSLMYENWKVEKHQLILSGKSIENMQAVSFQDTLDIIRQTQDSLIVGKYGAYQRIYYRKDMHILDSLKTQPETGLLFSEVYRGALSHESVSAAKDDTITIYHQQNNGDGVFEAVLNYPERNNRQTIQGRMYTLRGHQDNPNAVVIQLISFDGEIVLNFEKQPTALKALDKNMRLIEPVLMQRIN